MTYRDRRLARAERLREWADKRETKAAEAYAVGDPYRGDIAFNTQPGHIPERARVIRATERAWEHAEKAHSMASRADGIEHQVEHAIYDDDPDAIERLRTKLGALEAEREGVKDHNKAARKAKCECPDDCGCRSPYRQNVCGCKSHALPAYVLQNLGGNITRTRQRIARLEQREATTGTTAKPARLLALKYAGTCSACGAALDAGTMAYYDRAERAVTCRTCQEV